MQCCGLDRAAGLHFQFASSPIGGTSIGDSDIAGAERLVEAANVQIDLAKVAYFPLITLNPIGGFESGQFTSWLTGPSALWSVGASTLAAVNLLTCRMTSRVLLVKVLGGGWNVSKLPAVD